MKGIVDTTMEAQERGDMGSIWGSFEERWRGLSLEGGGGFRSSAGPRNLRYQHDKSKVKDVGKHRYVPECPTEEAAASYTSMGRAPGRTQGGQGGQRWDRAVFSELPGPELVLCMC